MLLYIISSHRGCPGGMTMLDKGLHLVQSVGIVAMYISMIYPQIMQYRCKEQFGEPTKSDIIAAILFIMALQPCPATSSYRSAASLAHCIIQPLYEYFPISYNNGANERCFTIHCTGIRWYHARRVPWIAI
jgi:hypothetical protein